MEEFADEEGGDEETGACCYAGEAEDVEQGFGDWVGDGLIRCCGDGLVALD